MVSSLRTATLRANYGQQCTNFGRRNGNHNQHAGYRKNFLPYPDRNKSKQILNLSRGQMRRLLELITGQSNLNYVQSKIYPEYVSPLCRFCEEEDETFAHLLNECPSFNSYRRDILYNKPVINTIKWKPKTLLDFSYIPQIDEA